MAGAVDVAIVGGGVVGCAAAAFLAEAGASVLLVESVGIASAASGRNSGVVQHPFDPVLAALYRATLAELRALEAADPAAFSLPAEPSGLLYVGEDADAARRVTDEIAAGAPEMAPSFLDEADVRRLEPALAPGIAACRLAIGFPVGPGRTTRAYEAQARAHGARIRVGAPAVLVRARPVSGGAGERVTGIRLGGRTVPTGTVLVAAGPWTPGLIDPSGSWRPIRRLWGAVAAVELAVPPRHVLEELEIDATIEPDEAGRGEASGGVPVAFSLVTADGSSVVGSTFSAEEPDDAALVPALLDRGARFVPALAHARVAASRRCARPLSLDGRPLVGALPGLDGVVVAAGHGPWGISTGAGTARLAADLVLGRVAAPPAALDPARFGYLAVADSR